MADQRPPTRVIDLAEARMERAFRRLLPDLLAYCREHLDDEPLAVDQFYGPDPDDEQIEMLQEAFVDWLAFNYRDWHGLTMLERFARETASLDETERLMLLAWQQTRPGLYLVSEQANGVVLLRDALTGAEQAVEQEHGMAPFAAGDLVVCRLLPVGDTLRFGLDVRSGPQSPMAAIRQALSDELDQFRLQEPDAGWDRLFAERWPLVNDAMTVAMVTGKAPRRPLRTVWPSLGLAAPAPGAPAVHAQVYELVIHYPDMSAADRGRAARLWLDAAAMLGPVAGKPAGWAAGVVLATLSYALLDPDLDRDDLAEAFGMSVATVSARARQLVRAVGLQELDPRYADPYDPRVRYGRPADQELDQTLTEAATALTTAADESIFAAMEREARREAGLLMAHIGPATPLDRLLAHRDKGSLERAARRLGIMAASRYRKAELAAVLSQHIAAQVPAVCNHLSDRERRLLRRLVVQGAPVPWADFCRRWSVTFHPAVQHDSVVYAPWELGLVHIGMPDGAIGPMVFVPEALAAALRQVL